MKIMLEDTLYSSLTCIVLVSKKQCNMFNANERFLCNCICVMHSKCYLQIFYFFQHQMLLIHIGIASIAIPMCTYNICLSINDFCST